MVIFLIQLYNFIQQPTNTWTNVSEVEANIGLSIQRLNKITGVWQPVVRKDNIAPCSNILNSYFEQVVVYANQTKLNISHSKNTVTHHLLNRLALSKSSRDTFQRTEGECLDSSHPDVIDTTLNPQWNIRRNWFVSADRGTPKTAHFRGRLYTGWVCLQLF